MNRIILGLALVLSLSSCTIGDDGPICVDDRNDNGKRQSQVMSKEPYPYGGFKWQYRLGCEGLYGTLVLSAQEYEVGDWYTTHQDFEEGLNDFNK